MRSIADTYAKQALQSVRNVQQMKFAKEYGRLCHQFPIMVLTNGLRLTVAFFVSKQKDEESPYTEYLKHIGLATGLDENWYKGDILNGSMTEYRDLTRRMLAASVWFKRYAEAILKVDPADMGD